MKNDLTLDTILISNNYIQIPEKDGFSISNNILGTIASNLLSYGYILSTESLKTLSKIGRKSIDEWWNQVESSLKEITGANRKMENFVVYKNFPAEVLEKTEAEYWIAQIFMYFGVPNEIFTQEVEERKPILEDRKLKVLKLANSNTLQEILTSLSALPSRWTSEQAEWVEFLLNEGIKINPSNVVFKENMAKVVALAIENDINVKVSSATDILRIGTALSDGDVTLKTNTKFKSLRRSVRKYLLKQLNSSTNLQDDLARDTERWKKFLYALHPFEFKKGNKFAYPKVTEASSNLYDDNVESFNSLVEAGLQNGDKNVLELLSSRPGDFIRRLRHTIDIFGADAVKSFINILPKLKVIQLIKTQKYLETINLRKYRTIAPNGNWTKLQILPNKHSIDEKYINKILSEIKKNLRGRLLESLRWNWS